MNLHILHILHIFLKLKNNTDKINTRVDTFHTHLNIPTMSSDKNKQKQINIYLSDSDKNDLRNKANISTDNMSQQYIILNNDKMRIANNKLSNDLGNLQLRFDELDEDSGRMEKTITNLKGFVKNIGEMNKLNNQLKKSYSKFQKDTRNILVTSCHTTNRLMFDKVFSGFVIVIIYIFLLYMDCVTVSSVTLALVLEVLVITTSIFAFNGDYAFITNSMDDTNIDETKYNQMRKKYTSFIADKIADLAELERGNEFLNDLIDMQ